MLDFVCWFCVGFCTALDTNNTLNKYNQFLATSITLLYYPKIENRAVNLVSNLISSRLRLERRRLRTTLLRMMWKHCLLSPLAPCRRSFRRCLYARRTACDSLSSMVTFGDCFLYDDLDFIVHSCARWLE